MYQAAIDHEESANVRSAVGLMVGASWVMNVVHRLAIAGMAPPTAARTLRNYQRNYQLPQSRDHIIQYLSKLWQDRATAYIREYSLKQISSEQLLIPILKSGILELSCVFICM